MTEKMRRDVKTRHEVERCFMTSITRHEVKKFVITSRPPPLSTCNGIAQDQHNAFAYIL